MNAVQALSAAIEWSKPMAENGDVNSTTDDDILLLYEVRALVAQRTHSLPAAERLILEYAQKGHFKTCSYRGDRLIPPGQWGCCYPNLGFWCLVDFDNSTVSYVYEGPPSETAKLVWEDVREGLEEFAEKFAREEQEKKLRRRRRPRARASPVRRRLAPPPPPSFLPSPFFQMTLVGLARDEVLSMLRKAWLLGPSEQLPALGSSASPETPSPSIPPAPSAPGSSSSLAEDRPSTPSTENKPKRRRSREQIAIREWADGKWPGGHQHLELRNIIDVADKDPEFRKKFPGKKFPERTKFARALDRRID